MLNQVSNIMLWALVVFVCVLLIVFAIFLICFLLTVLWHALKKVFWWGIKKVFWWNVKRTVFDLVFGVIFIGLVTPLVGYTVYRVIVEWRVLNNITIEPWAIVALPNDNPTPPMTNKIYPTRAKCEQELMKMETNNTTNTFYSSTIYAGNGTDSNNNIYHCPETINITRNLTGPKNIINGGVTYFYQNLEFSVCTKENKIESYNYSLVPADKASYSGQGAKDMDYQMGRCVQHVNNNRLQDHLTVLGNVGFALPSNLWDKTNIGHGNRSHKVIFKILGDN